MAYPLERDADVKEIPMRNRVINLAAFVILTLLWLGFGIVLLLNPDRLLAAWQALRGWPLVVQLLAWLLALPVMLGLWVWQTSLPLILRLFLVAGLAWGTIYAFYPWKREQQAETSLEPAPVKS
jgi:hypothetical protein